jgi:hypothetical protein
MEAEVTASAPHQMYQGTVAAFADTWATARGVEGCVGKADVAIKPP